MIIRYFPNLMIFVFLNLFSFLNAQPHIKETTSAVHGYVYNTAGKAVPNAQVYLIPGNRSDVTDRNGFFQISSKAGTYSLAVEHIAYQYFRKDSLILKEAAITTLDTIRLASGFHESESVIITATRSKKKAHEIIPILNNVKQIDIMRRNSKTSAEALREESGVFVQKTNHGGGSAIIRGLSSNQILILVDGIRLNNSTYRLGNHQYLTTVDNNMLDKIEVVHGPLSVLFGSDALGGTINLLTGNPGFTDQPQWNYAINGRYASADDEKTLSGRLNFKTPNYVFQSGFAVKNYGDLQAGKKIINKIIQNTSSGLQSPTAFSAYDFDGKLILAPAEKQRVILAYQRSVQEDVPRYDKYAYDDFKTWLYTPQNRDLAYLRYENNVNNSFIHSYQSTLSWQRQEEGRRQQKSMGRPLEIESDIVNTLGFTVQFNSSLSDHLLHYGFDFYTDDVHSTKKEISNNTEPVKMRGRYPEDAGYSSYGLFLEDEYVFDKEWSGVGGLRYSAFNTEFEIAEDPARGTLSKTFNAFTGSLGLMYKPSASHSFSFALGQGFRAPNLSDLTKFGTSKGDIFEVPNLNIKPEQALSIDLSYKLNTGKWHFNGSVYHMSIQKLLISANDTYNGQPFLVISGDTLQFKSKQNSGNANISGLESVFSYRFNKMLKVHGNFSYTYGRNKTLSEPVSGIPPFFGRLGLSWQKDNLFVDLFSRFAGEQTRLSGDDLDDPRIPAGGTPGWYTINIRAEYDWQPSVTLKFAVENVLDHLYREHGSGVNGPGRNFIIGLNISG